MSESIKAIEISNLQYQVRNHWTYKATKLLKDFSLDIVAGESFGFLGHNGAGKTTTIKCILNLIRPSAGSIKIFGVDSRETSARANVGYLAEQPYFYDYLTVREIVELYATLAGVSKGEISSAVNRALDLVKVSGRSKSPMRSLSKGLTQRVGLAQAIVAKPKLLLLDEPFSGLDPIGRKEFRDLFSNLRSEGTTIFMSSHILGDVEFLCDRVSILGHGELKGVFSVADIPRFAGGSYELVVSTSDVALKLLSPLSSRHSSEPRFLRFYFDDRSKAEQALEASIHNHLHVESYMFEQGGLEALFVKLVKFDEGKGGAAHA